MTTLKHKHGNFDLQNDVEKIKAALMNATLDVKGKAAEILTDSLEDIKSQSNVVKDSVAGYTADRPFKSLGIALLVGIAFGYLLHK